MQEVQFTIKSNMLIASQVWRMELQGDTSAITKPGQFVNIKLDGNFLRRPISVCDVDADTLTLVYKAVGAGTCQMSRMACGESLNLLTGLGNGYDYAAAGESPLLVGGGVGVPPLFNLARMLRHEGKRVQVALGFNSANDAILVDEFRALGCEVAIATIDGSMGTKGFVTNILPEHYSFFYACGPLPMLKALSKAVSTDGQMSLEERMGCGFGICVGCTQKTTNGFKRVCKEGPVFDKNEIIWE